jgi:hypothetical protein
MKQEHIKQIFARTDLQQIREFLVSGLDLDEIDKNPYDVRLEDGSLHITNRLKSHSKTNRNFLICMTNSARRQSYIQMFFSKSA